MGNVVAGKFVQKEEKVFCCINCEFQGFWIDMEGTVTCKACSTKQTPPRDWIDNLVALVNRSVEED